MLKWNVSPPTSSHTAAAALLSTPLRNFCHFRRRLLDFSEAVREHFAPDESVAVVSKVRGSSSSSKKKKWSKYNNAWDNNKMHVNYSLTMHSHKDMGLVLVLVRAEDITDTDMQSVPCREVCRCLLPPEGQKEREESSYTR